MAMAAVKVQRQAQEEAPADATAYVERVRSQLRQYLEVTSRPRADASRAIGVSDSVISQWLNGKYLGDNLRVAHSIDAWLQVEARRLGLPNEPVFVETRNAREILTVLRMCHELCDMGMIYGAAGSGKTRTAGQYQRDRGETVVRVTADHAIRAPYAFVAQVATVLGTTKTTRFLELRDGVIKKLARSGRLLIVDEAQKLTYNAIEMVRAIHDAAEVGVVFLGDEVLWHTITAGRSRAEYERLLSRIGFRRAIAPGLEPGDVAKIAIQYLGHTDEECIRFLAAKAGGVGGVRSVVKHCERAYFVAQAEGRSRVTVDDLHAAAALRGDDAPLVAVK